MRISNKHGQGMIEYLILVAVIAVSAMGVVRVVGHNVSIQFANIAKALGADNSDKIHAETVNAKLYSKKDLSNFMNGAAGETEHSSASEASN